MKATARQIKYIERLIGKTYAAEYDKLTSKTAASLISALLRYKRPIFCGYSPADWCELERGNDMLCSAEIAAFGHTFIRTRL